MRSTVAEQVPPILTFNNDSVPRDALGYHVTRSKLSTRGSWFDNHHSRLSLCSLVPGVIDAQRKRLMLSLTMTPRMKKPQ